MKACVYFYALCVVHVVRGSKGRSGKISHLQAWDCCWLSIKLWRPHPGLFHLRQRSGGQLQIRHSAGQPLPYTVEACKAD